MYQAPVWRVVGSIPGKGNFLPVSSSLLLHRSSLFWCCFDMSSPEDTQTTEGSQEVPLTNSLKHAAACRSVPQHAAACRSEPKLSWGPLVLGGGLSFFSGGGAPGVRGSGPEGIFGNLPAIFRMSQVKFMGTWLVEGTLYTVQPAIHTHFGCNADMARVMEPRHSYPLWELVLALVLFAQDVSI